MNRQSPLDIVKSHLSEIPVDLEALCDDLDVELVYSRSLGDGISGQIERRKDGSYKISVNANHSPKRQRFTIAHEISHYILHRPLIGDGLDDDIAYRSENVGKYHNRKVTRRHETEANKLAASILMPASLVRRIWPDNLDVHEMAEMFDVSHDAMRIRLQYLGLH